MVSLIIRRWAAGATVDPESLLIALREVTHQLEKDLGKPDPCPLSTAEIEAWLLRTCRAWRKAMDAELRIHRLQRQTEADLRKFWHGQVVRHSVTRVTLAEVLGLLSGDPADEHYYDRLQAWEQERLEQTGEGEQRG